MKGTLELPAAWPIPAQNFTIVWVAPYPTRLLSPSLFTGVTPASVGSLWIPNPTLFIFYTFFTNISCTSGSFLVIASQKSQLTYLLDIFPWMYGGQLKLNVFKTKLRFMQNLSQNTVDRVRVIWGLRWVVRRRKWHWKPPLETKHNSSPMPEYRYQEWHSNDWSAQVWRTSRFCIKGSKFWLFIFLI